MERKPPVVDTGFIVALVNTTPESRANASVYNQPKIKNYYSDEKAVIPRTKPRRTNQ